MRILSIEFTLNYIYIYEMNCGKKNVTVERKYKLDMPPNAYYNRMLINNDRSISDVIRNCITEHHIKTKKVVLMASDTDCMIEKFSVLGGTPKQIDGMVEQELRKRHKLSADYLYDYVVTGEDPLQEGFVTVTAISCVKAMLQNTYDIIKKAGLSPYRLVFVSNVMEKAAQMCKLTQVSESSIIACINQDEAHFLYVGYGQEPYYRYSRIKTEQNMEENFFVLSNFNSQNGEMDYDALLRKRVTEDLTRLGRFHSQRHPDKEISQIYLYGSYDKISSLPQYLRELLNIRIDMLPWQSQVTNIQYEFEEEEHIFNGVAAAATLLGGADYDFFGKLEEAKEGERDQMLFAPTLVSLALMIMILFMTIWNHRAADEAEREVFRVLGELQDPLVQQTYEEKNRMIEACNAYAKYNSQVKVAIDLLETMPRFDSDVLRELEEMRLEDVFISGYTFKDGVLSLGCYAENQHAPAEFAEILEESKRYKEVKYNGFHKNVGILGEINYSFTITLKLW